MTSTNTIAAPKQPPAASEAEVQDARARVSLYGVSVEYGLHCVLWLAGKDIHRASSRDLAELQGVPAATLAKIMPKLEKAGIVASRNGIAGGYALARPADKISVLDVIDAIEGGRRLFDCKEIRRGCALFGGAPPSWAVSGVCGIHAVMLRAEKRMRAELACTTLADLAKGIRQPPQFEALAASWITDRSVSRNAVRIAAVKQARARPRGI